jgi:hypothetical protein
MLDRRDRHRFCRGNSWQADQKRGGNRSKLHSQHSTCLLLQAD